jgi:hypothetical protein
MHILDKLHLYPLHISLDLMVINILNFTNIFYNVLDFNLLLYYIMVTRKP